ncbi:MAG TPA: DUF2304 family protein [Candidatus Aquicultor sp.]
MIIKILASLFALYALSRVYIRYRKRTASIAEVAVWALIWFGIIVIVMAPNKTNSIAHLVGMGRGFDALVFVSMLAVFYALFKVTAKLKQIEQEMTQLVSEIALSIGPANNPVKKDNAR